MKHSDSKKERDKAVIMAVVRRFGPISRVAIQHLTQYRPSTVSDYVRELIEAGRLYEAGRSDNPLGRKQVLLRVNDAFGFLVAMEFDAETIRTAVLDLEPKVLTTRTEPVDLTGGVEGVLKQLLSAADRAIRESRKNRAQLLGIAFADPGLVDRRRGISVMCALLDFWQCVPLRERFEARFGAPFLLEGNTRAKAVAERVLGAGGMAENMAYIDYSTGIGAAVFSEGRMVRGHSETAGEIGHTRVAENGPACKCGSFGCLEAIAGVQALGARARRALEEGSTSKVVSLAGGVEKVTGWTVLEAARQGDKLSSSLVETVSNHLGLGIANLVNLFNPALVVLGKNLASAGPDLLQQIERIVRRQALPSATEKLEFRYGTIGDEAALLGAGLLVLEEMFAIPVLKPPKFMLDEHGLAPTDTD
ncbi:MAG: ROK family protein [Acidobacteria bacterium]|nr:MAG: ROK family protein [Acidobacteriota bacterium]